jgi:uncharacterized protein
VNRLADETSPYLRQHRDNPVEWYPWGPEALQTAATDDKPILLSVGYSACHWCHVMAHESFEDAEVATAMNEGFVCIKVDREERPDVDAIYMEAVQAISGHGGWPMTVFMTADGKPFFGGTYYPKPQFLHLLGAIKDAWRHRRDELLEQAGQITESLDRMAKLTAPDGQTLPGTDVLNAALQQIGSQFDPEWGGFGKAPKFPQAMTLELCLRAHAHAGGDGATKVVTTSLDAMASGGMYDHLGGGFARYSVDAFWMVPHFEKMLYDQALLARVYLHGWQELGEERWKQVLDETVTYVLRDLRQPEGGFSSAEDADSEGEEGRFYVWRIEDIEAVLGDLAPAVIEWYGITKAGNFEGSNILHRPVRGDLLRPPSIEEARRLLFDAREHRVRPGLDDKVLTEWNALMLDSLARAAAATQRRDWLDAALANARFLVDNLRRDDGRWLRSWQRDGGARHLAFAADHAALIQAFVSLAEASGEKRWVAEAITTADALLDLFWDAEGGGVFTTGSDGEVLVTRPKDLLDNATPSANSMAALGLLRLAALTGERRYLHHAEQILALVGSLAATHPLAFPELLCAVDLHRSGATEIAVVGDRHDLVSVVHGRYLPNAVLAWGEPYESPLWESRRDGFAYVCRDYACLAPVDSVDALAAQLSASTAPQL